LKVKLNSIDSKYHSFIFREKRRGKIKELSAAGSPEKSELPGETNTSDTGINTNLSSLHGSESVSSHSQILADLFLKPIPFLIARKLLEQRHYLHSFPGGTMLAIGIFLNNRLLGAVTLGAGPFQGYSLVQGATRDDCVTLTRFWLSDLLPGNAESRVLALLLRMLRRHTSLKFVLAYADPAAGHRGTVYQASNWLFTGLSTAMAQYDFGDGNLHHSRSIGHLFGSHSLKHFKAIGLSVKVVPQAPKYRYIYFLNKRWRNRLMVPVLPYPDKGANKVEDN
jgi:hypothetical protein